MYAISREMHGFTMTHGWISPCLIDKCDIPLHCTCSFAKECHDLRSISRMPKSVLSCYQKLGDPYVSYVNTFCSFLRTNTHWESRYLLLSGVFAVMLPNEHVSLLFWFPKNIILQNKTGSKLFFVVSPSIQSSPTPFLYIFMYLAKL